jgi:hypothetical protein
VALILRVCFVEILVVYVCSQRISGNSFSGLFFLGFFFLVDFLGSFRSSRVLRN